MAPDETLMIESLIRQKFKNVYLAERIIIKCRKLTLDMLMERGYSYNCPAANYVYLDTPMYFFTSWSSFTTEPVNDFKPIATRSSFVSQPLKYEKHPLNQRANARESRACRRASESGRKSNYLIKNYNR